MEKLSPTVLENNLYAITQDTVIILTYLYSFNLHSKISIFFQNRIHNSDCRCSRKAVTVTSQILSVRFTTHASLEGVDQIVPEFRSFVFVFVHLVRNVFTIFHFLAAFQVSTYVADNSFLTLCFNNQVLQFL